VNVFPGSENLYRHYEDDGESLSYTTGTYTLTQFSFKSSRDTLGFQISLVKRDLSQCLPHRTYEIRFWRIKRPAICLLKINSVLVPVFPE
jgi:hypothetical protein